MIYRFQDRNTDRWEARQGATRLAAAMQLPIGSWQCLFIETDDTVEIYNPITHDRPTF